MTLKREIKDAYIEKGASIYVKTHSNAVYVNDNETETLTQRLDNVKKSITKHTTQLNDMMKNNIKWVNANICGADNTGATDCTDIIQNLLDNNTIVYLPSGLYLVSGIKLNSYNVIIGDGKNTVLTKNNYTSDNTPIIGFKQNSYLSEVRNLKITGHSMNDTNIYDGIFIPDATDTTTVYDVTHIISNVRIENVSGNGIYIGSQNRGCRIENAYVINTGKNGIDIEGTDNMLTLSSAGQCGEYGIILNQNNRLVSCKTFLSGMKDKTSYGLLIKANYNNISNLDLQQNFYGGIYIQGTSNNIVLCSDGIGTNNADNSGNISVIKLGQNARFNKISGCVTSGTLNGYFNYVMYAESPTCQVNNIIDVTCFHIYESLIDIKNINTRLHPSNVLKVNNIDINPRGVSETINNLFAVYSGHAAYDIPVDPTNNVYTYTFPLDMKDASRGGGCAFRLPPKSYVSKVNDCSYVYVEYDINSNITNMPNLEYIGKCFYSINNVFHEIEPTVNHKGRHKGHYSFVIDVRNITGITSDDVFTISFGLAKKGSIPSSLGNTQLTVSNLYIEFV